MAEYIDRRTMDNYIKRSCVTEVLLNSTSLEGYDLEEAVNAICAIPAADVRTVVRGKWEAGGMFDDIGRCSNCHYMFPIDTAMTEFHFCPKCGAKMEES